MLAVAKVLLILMLSCFLLPNALQGKQLDVIILSCVRATPCGEITVFFHYPVVCARHPKW